MERKIVIYGHPDKRPGIGFPTESDIEQWITEDIFTKYGRRYHHTLGMEADIIVISRDGLVHGHFEIEDKDKPSQKDYEDYPEVKFVYTVASSAIYDNPIRLSDLGIKGIQYGKTITEDQFGDIKRAAGGIRERHG